MADTPAANAKKAIISLMSGKISNDPGRLWRILVNAGEAPRAGLAFVARLARVLLLAMVSFAVNEVPVRAAALTFTTLLALIPFAVILSFVAGRLGYIDLLSRLIPALADSFNLELPLDPILNGLERAQGIGFQRMGWWGTLGLLVGFFFSMSNVESAVDRVWNLRKTRSWAGRFKVYTPFLLLLLALVFLSGRVLLRARDALRGWDYGAALPSFIPRGGFFLFGAVGVLVFVWVGLALMIRVLPNTRVRTAPALLGATAATAVIYFLSRFLFLFPKLLLAKNRFLYGSLAIIPISLLLIYVFWAAALFGASVAFIHQRLYRARGEDLRQLQDLLLFHDPDGTAILGPRNAWRELLHEVKVLYSRKAQA